MPDLATTYLGLELTHPLVASASPLSQDLDGIKRLEDAGAAAVVMFSLFEEQIRQENAAFEHLTAVGTESFPESLSYFPEVEEYEVGPEPYLELIRKATEATAIPIIGSLNGITSEGWIDYATRIEQAGAEGARAQRLLHPGRPRRFRARGRTALSGRGPGGEGGGRHPGRDEA